MRSWRNAGSSDTDGVTDDSGVVEMGRLRARRRMPESESCSSRQTTRRMAGPLLDRPSSDRAIAAIVTWIGPLKGLAS